MANEGIGAGALMVAEYEAVKEEQRARIGFRDNLLYATLVSVAAVLTAAFKGDGRTDVLLLLPPVCVLLGWTYLINDEKISAIGRYVRKDLGPRLGAAAGTRDPVFGWETAHRSDPRRASRKLLQLGVDQLAFCIPSFVSLIVYWVSGPTHAALVVASAFEAVAVAVLAVQIVLYADLKSGP